MLANTRLLFGAALALAACSVNAATQSTVGLDSTRAARVTAEQAAHQQMLLERRSATGVKSANTVNSATPGLPQRNPVAAYPASCLADPLPDQASGPTYSQNVSLAAFNTGTGQVDSNEIVNITIWRVACSSTEFFNSATLMRISRNSGSQAVYPLFPAIRVSQGSSGYADAMSIARAAVDPNTVVSDTFVDSPIFFDTTFVLENYANSAANNFDFNLPFGLRFDNGFASSNLFFVDVAAYNPTSGTYPAAFQNLPISGYMSTNWFDPSADGEGIVLQVYERVNDPTNLVVAFSWSAFDPSGVPFWLFGQVDIARGARSAISPMAYRTGGGFGGNAGAAGPPIIWGSATLSFPDCNHLTLTYAADAGLPSGIPQGSGTRTWSRVGDINGLPCE